jgi:hypothetical protein
MREVTTSNPAQNTVPCVRLEHSAVFYIVTITGFQTVAKKRLLVSLYPSCPSVCPHVSVRLLLDRFGEIWYWWLSKKERNPTRSSRLSSSRTTMPGFYTNPQYVLLSSARYIWHKSIFDKHSIFLYRWQWHAVAQQHTQNVLWLSTATMVKRTRYNVTLYVHCLSFPRITHPSAHAT